MIAVRNWFPNGCMAPNGCSDRACPICSNILETKPLAIEEAPKQQNPERDGAPKLSGERQRGNLAFQKRNRVGPHR